MEDPGIVKLNSILRSTERTAAIRNRTEFMNDGLNRAFAGAYDAVYNHEAKWSGYNSAGLPTVTAYGQSHVVNQVHGYKGIPMNTSVTLRVSEGFKTIDFQ